MRVWKYSRSLIIRVHGHRDERLPHDYLEKAQTGAMSLEETTFFSDNYDCWILQGRLKLL